MKDPLYRAIERHWREYRPQMVKELEATGTLEQAIEQAAERTVAAESSLMQNGMAPHLAMELCREQWAFLPSEADEPTLPPDHPASALLPTSDKADERAARSRANLRTSLERHGLHWSAVEDLVRDCCSTPLDFECDPGSANIEADRDDVNQTLMSDKPSSTSSKKNSPQGGFRQPSPEARAAARKTTNEIRTAMKKLAEKPPQT